MERKVYRRGYSGLCRRRVGLREWDSSDRRKSSGLDGSRVFRRARPRPRGLVRRGWYAGWARLCFYFSADGSVMTSDCGPPISAPYLKHSVTGEGLFGHVLLQPEIGLLFDDRGLLSSHASGQNGSVIL